MKQRLAIASTMVGDPELLIFDEPTNGLDPTGIAEVRTTIQHIAAQGKTILMASHILDEVEKVCTDVAIIKNGNLLAQGSVGGILTKDIRIEIGAADLDLLRGVLQEATYVHKLETASGHLIAYLPEGYNAEHLSRLAFNRNIILTHLVEKKRRLEDEFLAITANA
jgi:ABC-2 type transport system ATP-binding protein